MSRNRGKPKQKLSDLSREQLSHEEIRALTRSVSKRNDPIAAAILGSSLIEHELELCLRMKIPRKDGEIWKSLTSDVGPLSTFHRKIELAHALKILNEKQRDDLHVIRNIRNAFAHARRMIDFRHELVEKELLAAHFIDKRAKKRLLKLRQSKFEHHATYLILCLKLTSRLLVKHAGRPKKMSPLVKLLTGQTTPSLDDPKLRPAKIADALRAGPNPPAQKGLLGGLFDLGAEQLRTQGK